MAHLIDTRNPEQFQYERPGWEMVFNKFKPAVLALPQVKSDAVSNEQAENWLEVASKSLKESEVRRLIIETSGFTANDVRALWAFDNNEYYPKYEASEVYRQKQLTAVRLPDNKIRDENWLKLVLKNVAKEKYQFDLAQEFNSDSEMAFKGKIPWALSNDVNSGLHDDLLFTYDLKVNYNHTVTHTDTLRHHFNTLAILNKGQQTRQCDQYNISIGPELTNTIIALAKNPDTYNQAVHLAKTFEGKPGGISISKESVTPQPEVFNSLVKCGSAHWTNVLQGNQPEFEIQSRSQFSDSEKQQYDSLAQEYVTSKFAKELASENFNACRSKLTELVGIDRAGPGAPHPLVHAGKNSTFDINAAANLLHSKNVPEHFYKETKYDIDALVKAARAAGVEVEQFQSFGSANKEKVIESLAMVGVDKDTFMQPGIHVHMSGQSRGATAEVLQSIQAQVHAQYETMVTTTLESKSIAASTIESQINPAQSNDNKTDSDSITMS